MTTTHIEYGAVNPYYYHLVERGLYVVVGINFAALVVFVLTWGCAWTHRGSRVLVKMQWRAVRYAVTFCCCCCCSSKRRRLLSYAPPAALFRLRAATTGAMVALVLAAVVAYWMSASFFSVFL